jgi:hypothetical protein
MNRNALEIRDATREGEDRQSVSEGAKSKQPRVPTSMASMAHEPWMIDCLRNTETFRHFDSVTKEPITHDVAFCFVPVPFLFPTDVDDNGDDSVAKMPRNDAQYRMFLAFIKALGLWMEIDDSRCPCICCRSDPSKTKIGRDSENLATIG